jgi:hypothetical protein
MLPLPRLSRPRSGARCPPFSVWARAKAPSQSACQNFASAKTGTPQHLFLKTAPLKANAESVFGAPQRKISKFSKRKTR